MTGWGRIAYALWNPPTHMHRRAIGAAQPNPTRPPYAATATAGAASTTGALGGAASRYASAASP